MADEALVREHKRVLSNGVRLLVRDTYQAVTAEPGALAAWSLTLREAEVDGELVTDPTIARDLARLGGIPDAEPLLEAR